MTNRTTWIVAVTSVVLVAIGLVAWRTWGPSQGSSGSVGKNISVAGVVFETPDIVVDLVDLKATKNPDYTEWACFFVCRENDGCRADVRLEIIYQAQGEERKINIAGRFDSDRDEKMRLGRVQRPPLEISRIEELTVIVEGGLPQVEVVPTPMM